MENVIKQINDLYRSADSINFATSFSADELVGCTTLEEALPKVTELYATPKDPRYPQEIKYVHPSTAEEMWEAIDQAFANKGDYDAHQGIRLSDDEAARLAKLQKEYRAIVEGYLRPDMALYSFVSSRTTFDLFGFMILNKDGKSLAILAENSD